MVVSPPSPSPDLWGAVAFVLLAAATADASSPNLVFLLLDDMDSELNATGVMPIYTQRFIAEGLSFPHAFASSPKCCPSRNSLLSGRFAHRMNDTQLGWCGDWVPAARYDATFIASLKGAGYRTGLFGKMTNDMGPLVCPSGSQAPAVPLGFNLSSGDAFVAMCNETEYYSIAFNRNGAMYTTPSSGDAAYLQAFLGNETLPWLREAAAGAAAGGAPFFAYLAPHAPHFSAEPAPWYADAPLPRDTAPRLPSYNATGEGKHWALRENGPIDAFTENAIDTHFRNRQRSLMSVDDYVAAIFEVLQEAPGVLNNTFFIATSDHGYHLGEFRVPFEKSLCYETDVKVPFYVRGPGVPAGASSDAIVSLIDVGATFLELAGVVPPGGQRTTDGRSLVPLLGGGTPPSWRTTTLIEFFGFANQWMSAW